MMQNNAEQVKSKDVFFIRHKDGSKDVFNSSMLGSSQEESIVSHNKTMSYEGIATRIKILSGVEYKRLEAGFGYDCISPGSGNAMHLGFFKIGLRLGKLK